MLRQNIGKLCSANNCNNRDATGAIYDGKKVRFHCFPFDATISIQWAVNSRNAALESLTHEQLRKRVMCSAHFEDECYVRPFDRDQASCRLRWDAVPTIFNLTNPPSSSQTIKIPKETEEGFGCSLGSRMDGAQSNGLQDMNGRKRRAVSNSFSTASAESDNCNVKKARRKLGSDNPNVSRVNSLISSAAAAPSSKPSNQPTHFPRCEFSYAAPDFEVIENEDNDFVAPYTVDDDDDDESDSDGEGELSVGKLARAPVPRIVEVVSAKSKAASKKSKAAITLSDEVEASCSSPVKQKVSAKASDMKAVMALWKRELDNLFDVQRQMIKDQAKSVEALYSSRKTDIEALNREKKLGLNVERLHLDREREELAQEVRRLEEKQEAAQCTLQKLEVETQRLEQSINQACRLAMVSLKKSGSLGQRLAFRMRRHSFHQLTRDRWRRKCLLAFGACLAMMVDDERKNSKPDSEFFKDLVTSANPEASKEEEEKEDEKEEEKDETLQFLRLQQSIIRRHRGLLDQMEQDIATQIAFERKSRKLIGLKMADVKAKHELECEKALKPTLPTNLRVALSSALGDNLASKMKRIELLSRSGTNKFREAFLLRSLKTSHIIEGFGPALRSCVLKFVANQKECSSEIQFQLSNDHNKTVEEKIKQVQEKMREIKLKKREIAMSTINSKLSILTFEERKLRNRLRGLLKDKKSRNKRSTVASEQEEVVLSDDSDNANEASTSQQATALQTRQQEMEKTKQVEERVETTIREKETEEALRIDELQETARREVEEREKRRYVVEQTQPKPARLRTIMSRMDMPTQGQLVAVPVYALPATALDGNSQQLSAASLISGASEQPIYSFVWNQPGPVIVSAATTNSGSTAVPSVTNPNVDCPVEPTVANAANPTVGSVANLTGNSAMNLGVNVSGPARVDAAINTCSGALGNAITSASPSPANPPPGRGHPTGVVRGRGRGRGGGRGRGRGRGRQKVTEKLRSDVPQEGPRFWSATVNVDSSLSSLSSLSSDDDVQVISAPKKTKRERPKKLKPQFMVISDDDDDESPSVTSPTKDTSATTSPSKDTSTTTSPSKDTSTTSPSKDTSPTENGSPAKETQTSERRDKILNPIDFYKSLTGDESMSAASTSGTRQDAGKVTEVIGTCDTATATSDDQPAGATDTGDVVATTSTHQPAEVNKKDEVIDICDSEEEQPCGSRSFELVSSNLPAGSDLRPSEQFLFDIGIALVRHQYYPSAITDETGDPFVEESVRFLRPRLPIACDWCSYRACSDNDLRMHCDAAHLAKTNPYPGPLPAQPTWPNHRTHFNEELQKWDILYHCVWCDHYPVWKSAQGGTRDGKNVLHHVTRCKAAFKGDFCLAPYVKDVTFITAPDEEEEKVEGNEEEKEKAEEEKETEEKGEKEEAERKDDEKEEEDTKFKVKAFRMPPAASLWSCEVCEQTLPSRKAAFKHMKRQHSTLRNRALTSLRKLRCRICQISFATSEGLFNHVVPREKKSASGDVYACSFRLRCPLCPISRSLMSLRSWPLHFLVLHGDIAERRMENNVCPFCYPFGVISVRRQLPSELHLTQHLARWHDVGGATPVERMFGLPVAHCSACGVRVVLHQMLKHMQRRHTRPLRVTLTRCDNQMPRAESPESDDVPLSQLCNLQPSPDSTDKVDTPPFSLKTLAPKPQVPPLQRQVNEEDILRLYEPKPVPVRKKINSLDSVYSLTSTSEDSDDSSSSSSSD